MTVSPGNGGVTYSSLIETTEPGEYEYTLRVGVKKGTGVIDWKWAGGFGENVKIRVS